MRAYFKRPLSIRFCEALKEITQRLAAGALLVASGASARAEGQAPQAPVSKTIDRFMKTVEARGQFNGSILVSSGGSVIYRHSFGYADLSGKRKLTLEMPSCIGSVTKPFTALAIMMLADEGRISFDAPISKYIQPFASSPATQSISLRQLLNHTSGIPDYTDLGIDDSHLTKNDFVFQVLEKQSRFGTAGDRYRYSNPGYVLLQLVIEKVSGRSYAEFLQQRIFSPLRMLNTYVYDIPLRRNPRAATGIDQFGHQQDTGPNQLPGSGGIYSTVDDLYKLDTALSGGQLVRPATLEQAYTPGKVSTGVCTYGFGWNLGNENGEKYTWHTGNAAGYRAFIERHPGRRLTVIMLTNRGNSKRVDINKAIRAIISGKLYLLPKVSIAEKLYPIIMKSGIQAALSFVNKVQVSRSTDYDFSESDLNTLGYQLLYGDHRPSDSLAIFKLTTTAHPNSSNAFDSLGEAYVRNGNLGQAIRCYLEAVKLDPANIRAVSALKELKSRAQPGTS